MVSFVFFLRSASATTGAPEPLLSDTPVFEFSEPDIGIRLEVVDINDDGLADILAGSFDNNRVFYGDTSWPDPAASWVAPANASEQCAADVDGDGFLEVFSSGREYSGATLRHTMEGYGGGATVGSLVWKTEGDWASYLSLSWVPVPGDFDGDGFDDLVVVRMTDGELHAYSGSALGLSATASHILPGSSALALDIDGDGYDDLLVSDAAGLTAYGGSGFGLDPVPRWSEPNAPYELFSGQVLDVDGDGAEDVIYAWRSDVMVRYGVADGTLAPATTLLAGSFDNVAMGDVDGDGFLDLAVQDRGVVSVFRGDGSGIEQTASWTMAPDQPSAVSIALGDVNGDGLDDLVAADWGLSTGYVLVYRGGGNEPVLEETGHTGTLGETGDTGMAPTTTETVHMGDTGATGDGKTTPLTSDTGTPDPTRGAGETDTPNSADEQEDGSSCGCQHGRPAPWSWARRRR